MYPQRMPRQTHRHVDIDAAIKTEALKHHENLVALLKRELSTGPDAATRSLAAELRSAQPPSRSPVVKQSARTRYRCPTGSRLRRCPLPIRK